MCEFLTQLSQELKALWLVMRVGWSIVVPRPHGERSG